MSERVRVNLIDDRERAVVVLWRKGHISSRTIQIYLQWVGRFRAFCEKRKLDETEQVTLTGVLRFTQAYAGPRLKARRIAGQSRAIARNALHAWACSLRALGTPLPPWRDHNKTSRLPPLLDEYCHYRRSHNGVSESTLIRDVDTARGFLAQLRLGRKSVERATLVDVDAFVRKEANRVSKRTVADTCSSLRAFLRFLQATGKLRSDLASGVLAPRVRQLERPPRTLPWSDVKRILRSIPRTRPPGRRDYAILLLMATYGLGAAEVLGLRFDDLDWKACILRARRPKTKVAIELPLLPAVANALSVYLRWERPPAKGTPYLFLRKNMPYKPITSAAIRHCIQHYAHLAGISVKVIGAHAFRHSHATRQVDAGANLKVVSDILGHRNISSTSVYVRVALRRLRAVALPVPR